MRRFLFVFVLIFLSAAGLSINVINAEEIDISAITTENTKELKFEMLYEEEVLYGTDDFYKFTPELSGYISFLFTRKTGDEDTPVFYLFDTSKKSIGRYSSKRAKKEEKSFTVRGGQEYYVLVRYDTLEDYSELDDKSKPKLKYTMTLEFTEAEKVMTGANTSISSADTLTEDAVCYGAICDESDYYKVEASENCVVTVEFKSSIDTGSGYPKWKYTAYDDKQTKLYSLNTDSKAYIKQQYVLKKGSCVYFSLTNKRAAKNHIYQLKVTKEAVSDIETEPNNEFRKATKAVREKVYTGALNEKTDDYYVFTCDKLKTIKLKLKLDESVESPYRLTVYNSHFQQIAESSSAISSAGMVKFRAEKGETYYIRIYHSYKSGQADYADVGISFGVAYHLNIDNRKV